MSYTVPLFGVAVVAVLAGVIYTTSQEANKSTVPTSTSDDPVVVQAEESSASNDPSNDQNIQATEFSDNTEVTPLPSPDANGKANLSPTRVDGSFVGEAIDFAQSVARTRTDDATLKEQADALRNDPAKLAAVLNEFSAETDTERLSRLRLLLGQLDDLSMVSVAESMVFSGNPASSNEALKLLRDIGPNVPAARDIGVSVLSSTQDPQMLVGATHILTSSAFADATTKERVVTSLSSLVQHPDATVRRASFSTLARWSKDASTTPTLLQGLNDEDPSVRKSTAYGFVGYQHADASVISALLNTAENTTEQRRARSGAILALSGMPLDDSQRARLQAVKAQF